MSGVRQVSVVLQVLASLQFSLAAALITVPLDKQYVPVIRNNKTVSYKTAYFGKIFLGLPEMQDFTVVFDTGSGHLFLPSSRCNTETCQMHRRYDRANSSSAVDIDHSGKPVPASARIRDQVNIAYGTGEVTGDFVRETLCLANRSGEATLNSPDCISLRVITATELTKEPFHSFHFDGVLGLGLESLAVDPEFSFFGQFSRSGQLAEQSFGYFLSRIDDVASEISFGGQDERRMASSLEWVSVHRPELGFWQVRVQRVSIDGEAFPLCEDGNCIAIADTGTSLIGAPRAATQRLHWLMARKVPDNPEEIDCRSFPGPDLVFELEGGVNITVGPEDYSRSTAMRVLQNKTGTSQVICRASLLPVDGDEVLGPKAWILGEPVLRKYYTAYDWQNQRVGFALSAQPPSTQPMAQTTTHSVFGAPPRAAPTPTLVVV